jgi:hypothetical protein
MKRNLSFARSGFYQLFKIRCAGRLFNLATRLDVSRNKSSLRAPETQIQSRFLHLVLVRSEWLKPPK